MSTVIAGGAAKPVRRPDTATTSYWDLAKALIAVLIGMMVANAAAIAIAGSLIEPGQKYEDNATAFSVVLVSSMIIVELLLLAAALWFGPHKHRLPLSSLGLRKPERTSWWLPVAMALTGLLIANGFVVLLSAVGVDLDDSSTERVFDNAGPFLIVAVGSVLMAPVIEEIFFRGFLYGGLVDRRGWLVAAAISSLVFGLAHLSPYLVLPYAAIGFLFAWSYRYTGSIKAAIISHAIINLVSLGLIPLT